MNRDWFLQTQVETQTRIAAYLQWQPHVTIDAHEMGSNSEYYFDPPADPILELITPKQREWFARFGTRQGRRFDQYGFPYTSREVYDAFYPGYGSTWPTLHGSIGILWEQAGARGLVIDRDDQKKLHYHDGVRHHYVSSISTVETAAAMGKELVKDFYDYRASAIALGRDGPVRDYVLLPGSTPARAARLAQLLVNNGIEVRRVTEPAAPSRRKGAIDDAAKDWTVPAGSYHVTVAQPAGRLARSLLDSRFDMGEAFRKRQLDRKVRRLDDEIYDLTALVVAAGVRHHLAHGRGPVENRQRTDRGPESDRNGDRAGAGEGRLPDPRRRRRRDGRARRPAPPWLSGPRLRPADDARRRKVRQGDAPLEDERKRRLASRGRPPACARARPVGPRDRHRARRRGGGPGQFSRELGQASQGRDAGRPTGVSVRRAHLVPLRPGLALSRDARPGLALSRTSISPSTMC